MLGGIEVGVGCDIVGPVVHVGVGLVVVDGIVVV